MPDLRIGISGWTYAPWRGTFYPKGLKQSEELAYASRRLNSIEINGTFYSLAKPASFALWYEQTPDSFVFSIKGGRFITHIKRLKGVETALANFFASGILQLKEKLGPILWQLPPNYKWDEQTLEAFFQLLPRDTIEAARVAKDHDSFMKGRSWTKTDAKRPLRYAIEVRHESFKTPAFIKLLRKHRIALCIAETANKWPFMEDVTTDFLYLRLHGDEELYVSGYSDVALDAWAAKVDAWKRGAQPKNARLVSDQSPAKRKGRDVYVYFDNDVKVRSPLDAMGLARRLKIKTPNDVVEKPPGAIMEQARKRWPSVRSRKAKPDGR